MSQTEKLITLVRNYPLLYDLSHDDYKNNRKKDSVWDIIGKELNEDGDHLKKKWRNIRDTYAKYLRSMRTKSGQSVKKNYTNWQWAPLMETFRPFFAFADTVSNIKIDITDHNEDDISVENNFEEQYEEWAPEIVASQSQMENKNSLSAEMGRKRKRTEKQLAAPQENSSVNAVLEYLKNKRTAPSIDAIDIIFQGYVQTLKQFSPRRQAEVKIKIATIMANEEMLHQQEQLLLSD